MSTKRRVKRSAAINSGAGDADAYVLMTDILDKLHILQYHQDFLAHTNLMPLQWGYFAYPANIAEQFNYFQSLCLWLLKYIDHKFLEWDDFNDPNSISNNIVQECKKLQFSKEFASNKLRQGSGREVCEILDFLTTLALKKINYQIQTPVFHKASHTKPLSEDAIDSQDMQNVNIDDDHSEDSMAEDIVDDESEIHASQRSNQENINAANKAAQFRSNAKGDDVDDNDLMQLQADGDTTINDENEQKTTMSVMQTQISSKEWALELETVSHLLEDRYITGVKEWSTHLKKAKHHGKALKEMWPESKAKLSKYAQRLAAYLETVKNKETHLNAEFSGLCQEYKTKYDGLHSLKQTYNDNIAQISSLTNDLQDIEEKISDVKTEMEHRNHAMTDVTPIRRLREAHNALNSEIIDLDLRIGIIRQQLLHSKLTHQKQQQQQQQQPQQQQQQHRQPMSSAYQSQSSVPYQPYASQATQARPQPSPFQQLSHDTTPSEYKSADINNMDQLVNFVNFGTTENPNQKKKEPAPQSNDPDDELWRMLQSTLK